MLCGRLFVAHLNEADMLLVHPQRLKNSVDAVTRQAEYCIHAPIDHQGSPAGIGRALTKHTV